MIVITATEFRENQKDIFDKVADDQQAIVKRGKDAFLVTKLSEIDRISLNPNLIDKVEKGLRDFKAGNYRIIKSTTDLYSEE